MQFARIACDRRRAMQDLSTSDPLAHARNVRVNLDEMVEHLRRDVTKVHDPKARALFNTAADVLNGLVKAFADYEQNAKTEWK
jgi:hypothetical protein